MESLIKGDIQSFGFDGLHDNGLALRLVLSTRLLPLRILLVFIELEIGIIGNWPKLVATDEEDNKSAT